MVGIGAQFIAPILFILTYIYLAIRLRSFISILGLSGAFCYFLGTVIKKLFPDTLSIALGYRIPTVDSNIFIWSLFHYGIDFGLLILSFSTLFLLIKHYAEK